MPNSIILKGLGPRGKICCVLVILAKQTNGNCQSHIAVSQKGQWTTERSDTTTRGRRRKTCSTFLVSPRSRRLSRAACRMNQRLTPDPFLLPYSLPVEQRFRGLLASGTLLAGGMKAPRGPRSLNLVPHRRSPQLRPIPSSRGGVSRKLSRT